MWRRNLQKAELKKGKGEASFGTEIHTIPGNGKGRYLCRVQEKYYSKPSDFMTLTTSWHRTEDKNAIFENWCDFLNYFDSSIHFQVSFINHHSSMKEFESAIQIRPQNDAFDDVRMEYAQMLKISWQKEIMAWYGRNTLHLELRRRTSGKQSRSWNVSKRIF